MNESLQKDRSDICGLLIKCSEADQEHLNAQEHQIFAQAVYEKTERMLWKRSGWRQVV